MSAFTIRRREVLSEAGALAVAEATVARAVGRTADGRVVEAPGVAHTSSDDAVAAAVENLETAVESTALGFELLSVSPAGSTVRIALDGDAVETFTDADEAPEVVIRAFGDAGSVEATGTKRTDTPIVGRPVLNCLLSAIETAEADLEA